MILGCQLRYRDTHNSLVDIVTDKRGVEEERQPLSRQQEEEGKEGVGDHLGEYKLRG